MAVVTQSCDAVGATSTLNSRSADKHIIDLTCNAIHHSSCLQLDLQTFETCALRAQSSHFALQNLHGQVR